MAQNCTGHFCAIFRLDRRVVVSRRIYTIQAFFILIFFIALVTACDALPLPSILGTPPVANVVLAKDFKIDMGMPVDITTEYAPEQNNFHLVVTVNDAPKDTRFRSAWRAIDIGGTTRLIRNWKNAN